MGSSLRGAIDETKAEVVLLLLIVDVKATCDLVFEVLVDLAGVVLHLNLPHAGNTKQHVLIVDEWPVSIAEGLVVVPFGPVQAV